MEPAYLSALAALRVDDRGPDVLDGLVADPARAIPHAATRESI